MDEPACQKKNRIRDVIRAACYQHQQPPRCLMYQAEEEDMAAWIRRTRPLFCRSDHEEKQHDGPSRATYLFTLLMAGLAGV